MSVAVRPVPSLPTPDGFHYEVVAVAGWTTPPVGSGHCRSGASRYQQACGKPAVATLWRNRFTRSGPTRQPWDYCAEHLYGGWIEDGRVVRWRLVSDEGAA